MLSSGGLRAGLGTTKGVPALLGTPFGEVLVWVRRVGSPARDDVDDATTALATELDGATDEGEQGVVTAAADAAARVEVRAALADDDLTGVDDLAAEALHAQPLRVGVAAVLGGRRALLVCHLFSPSRW